jgi:predicted metal-binding protein
MNKQLEEWIVKAQEIGFSHAALLDCATLEPKTAVRDMCAANTCHLYNASWMCPPGCGSLEANIAAIAPYKMGILVQTTGNLEDDFDYETMMETGELQKSNFVRFRDILKESFPGMLALSSGGCSLCEKCTYPDNPCRFPQKALSSMEAYGLLVSDVCLKNGLAYYYGPKTLTYTGCYLLT